MPEKHGYPSGKENHKRTSYKTQKGMTKTKENKGYADKGTSNKAGFNHRIPGDNIPK